MSRSTKCERLVDATDTAFQWDRETRTRGLSSLERKGGVTMWEQDHEGTQQSFHSRAGRSDSANLVTTGTGMKTQFSAFGLRPIGFDIHPFTPRPWPDAVSSASTVR